MTGWLGGEGGSSTTRCHWAEATIDRGRLTFTAVTYASGFGFTIWVGR